MDEILKRVVDLIEDELLSYKSLIIKYQLLEKNKCYSDEELETLYYLYKLIRIKEMLSYDNESGRWSFFEDFETIMNIMDYYQFSGKDKLSVMIYLINKNINADYINGKNKFIIFENILNAPIKNNVKNELITLAFYGGMEEKIQQLLNLIDDNGQFIGEYDKTLSKSEILLMKEMYAYLPELTEMPLSKKKYIEAHNIIKEHYISKKDNYDVDDIVETTKGFIYLDVPKEICEAFYYIMKKELEKRNKNITPLILPSNCMAKNVEKTNILSKKEYNQLLLKLNEHFDTRTKTTTHALNMEEIVNCTQILLQLGFKEDEIKSYIKIMDKSQDMNPISWYLNNSEKLKFYCNDSNYENRLINLESYFQELFICNDEEYNLWKDSIVEELNELKQMVPKTYEYELRMANNRTK